MRRAHGVSLAIFDLDNTLINQSEAFQAWAHDFSLSLSPPVPGAFGEELISADNDGFGGKDRFRSFAARYGLDVDVLVAESRSGVRQRVELVAGAAAVLSALRGAGWRVAVVSNGDGATQRSKMERVGLLELVDSVKISGDEGVRKPDVRLLGLAAADVGASMRDAWVIGDSPYADISGGLAAGAQTVWIRRGRTWEEDLYVPHASIDDLAELPDLLLK